MGPEYYRRYVYCSRCSWEGIRAYWTRLPCPKCRMPVLKDHQKWPLFENLETKKWSEHLEEVLPKEKL
jgi:hypothetical protein